MSKQRASVISIGAAVAALAAATGTAFAGELRPSSGDRGTAIAARAAFGGPIDNPYLPLRPETVFRYRGTIEGQPAEETDTVTERTRVILGVTCVVVKQELAVGGVPAERTTDYYAQDETGNVWYFGEDSFDYVNGSWVRSDGSWLAGVDGAAPGIVMEAHPRVGDTYKQELYPGHAQDRAKVLRVDASVRVAYGAFHGTVLQTKEWTPLEPRTFEYKYYAPGVGEVRSIMVAGGSEELVLVSVSHGDDD